MGFSCKGVKYSTLFDVDDGRFVFSKVLRAFT